MSYNNGPKIITDGLVALFDAGNSKSYPGTGTSWTDLANNKIGTLTNGPTFDANNKGSILFDGTNDYVNVGSIDGDFSNFTILFWFYSGSISEVENILDCNFNVYASTGNVGPRFETRNTGGTKYLTFIISGNTSNNGIYQTNVLIPNGSFQDNTWYYSGLIKNSSNLYGVNNGVMSSAIALTQSAVSSIGNLQIGRGFHLGGSERYFSNRIPSVQIYNRAVSSVEVAQNYNAIKGRFQL